MLRARVFAASVLCAILAACGGGGGGGTTPPITSPTAGPTATATPPVVQQSITQQPVQQADLQAGLAGVQAGRNFAGTTTSTFTRVRTLRNALRARRFTTTACNNGVITITTPGATTSQETVEIDTYYDVTCLTLKSKVVWSATASGNSVSGPATQTLYSQSGALTETDTMQIVFYYDALQNLTGFSLLTSSMQNASSAQLGEAGVACTTLSASSIACGVAAVANGASGEAGANVSASATLATSTSLSMQIATYQSGSQNGLSIASGTLPNFVISPSSDALDSVSLTGSISATTVAFTVSDATYGGTLQVTGSSSGTVTGTLTNNAGGAQVASFSIDGSGDGTVTYGNGSTATVTDYTIGG